MGDRISDSKLFEYNISILTLFESFSDSKIDQPSMLYYLPDMVCVKSLLNSFNGIESTKK
jgi:hypothetical protein